MRTHVLSAVAAVLLAATPAPADAQATRSPEALARAVEQRYAGVRDFSADFTQTYQSPFVRVENRERGTLAIKKPGRIRWLYDDPDPKEVVSDGEKIYFFVPADQSVQVQDVPSGDQASTADLFLSGKGDIAADFTPAIVEGPIAGTLGLELTPVHREASYERLVLAVDPETLQIRGLTTFDTQGGRSAIRFDNLRENTGIDDGYFHFQIPRGVDVQFD